MAVSKVSAIVLLGVLVAALVKPNAANPDETTTAAHNASETGSTVGSYGSAPSASGNPDCLSDSDKAKICDLSPNSTSSSQGLCATVGAADDFCAKLAASVSGTSPCCLEHNVCSFKVASNSSSSYSSNGSTDSSTTTAAYTTAAASDTTAASTTAASTTAAASDTTAASTTAASTTAAASDTTATSTTAGTGSTHAGSAIVPEPNTVYVSCETVPAGFEQIKTCPSGKTIFVYPGSSDATTTPSTTPSTTTTAKY